MPEPKVGIKGSEDDACRLTVEHLYLGLLERHPDPAGLNDYANRLDAGETVIDIARDIKSSEEFHRSANGYITGSEKNKFWGQSQHGELQALMTELMKRGSRHQSIVDVGARGRQRSNSYDLLKSFGWNGLLVEANPRLVGAIMREFEDTDFTLENVAISTFSGEADFFIADNADVSSLNERAVLHWGAVASVVATKVCRLHDLLARHQVPLDFDVLSLDIEGHDIAVFNDLLTHSAYRPRYAFIEVHDSDNPGSLTGRKFCETAVAEYVILDRIGPNLFLSHQDG